MSGPLNVGGHSYPLCTFRAQRRHRANTALLRIFSGGTPSDPSPLVTRQVIDTGSGVVLLDFYFLLDEEPLNIDPHPTFARG